MPHKIIQKLSHSARKDNLLQKIESRLLKEFGLTPIIGAEIEFYVKSTEVLKDIPYKTKDEKGNNQFEIDIFPDHTLMKTIESISYAKNILIKLPDVSLHPKPYHDDFGSAMHFHLNLINKNGDNIFDDSQILNHAAKSLCNFLLRQFLIFAPYEHHYSRFDHNFMAPTKVCFGNNNRTTAIRIPNAKPYRIEHRVSSPETDEYLAVCAILSAIYKGFKNPDKIEHHEKIYGNAFDAQYKLIDLPKSLHEAALLFRPENLY